MAALEIFANMQENYGEVLSSRTPDVQEANLGDQPRREGRLVLAVVGPPGSRDAAAACARSSRLPATAVAGLLRGDHRIGIRDTGTGLYIPMSGA